MCLTTSTFRNNEVECTLWGEFANQMNAYLNTESECTPTIIILQQGKLNTFNGLISCVTIYQPLFYIFYNYLMENYHLCIGKNGISNAFYGTKLLINPAFEEARQYKEK